MKMKRFTIAGAALLLCFTFAVAGCQKKNSEATQSANASASPTETPVDSVKEDSPITLKVDIRNSTRPYYPGRKDMYVKAKERFEAEHKGVVVDLNGEADADVVELGTKEFLMLAQNGSLMNLNPYFEKDGIRREDFIPSLLNLHTVNNNIFALPVYPEPVAIFYDTSFFEKTPDAQKPLQEWNWEQFKTIAQSIQKARAKDGDSQGAALLPFDANWLESLVLSNGGSFLSPDGSKATGYMDSDATVEAITAAADLIRKTKVVPTYTNQWDDWSYLRDFPDEGPMIMQYFYYYNEIGTTSVGSSFDVAPLPRFEGKEPGIAIWSYGHGINAKSEHPDLAWQFLKELFLDANEVSRQWTKTDLIAYKPLVKASDPYPTAAMNVFASALPYVKKSAEYTNANWASIRASIVNPGLAELIRSDADVKEALTAIAQKVDAELN